MTVDQAITKLHREFPNSTISYTFMPGYNFCRHGFGLHWPNNERPEGQKDNPMPAQESAETLEAAYEATATGARLSYSKAIR